MSIEHIETPAIAAARELLSKLIEENQTHTQAAIDSMDWNDPDRFTTPEFAAVAQLMRESNRLHAALATLEPEVRP